MGFRQWENMPNEILYAPNMSIDVPPIQRASWYGAPEQLFRSRGMPNNEILLNRCCRHWRALRCTPNQLMVFPYYQYIAWSRRTFRRVFESLPFFSFAPNEWNFIRMCCEQPHFLHSAWITDLCDNTKHFGLSCQICHLRFNRMRCERTRISNAIHIYDFKFISLFHSVLQLEQC